VTPHGLRGTGATNDLLRELVASVSRKLGHTGTEVALNHYLDPDVVAQVRRALVQSSLWDQKKRSHEGPTGKEPSAG
jgi:integrase